MIFECPSCTQNIEVDNAEAGRTIHCPTCGQQVIIPDPNAPAEATQPSAAPGGPHPPIHVPLQPLSPGASKPLIKKRQSLGCGSFLFVLTAAAATAFILTMHRYQESPQRAWERIVRGIFQKEAPPTGEPTPTQEVAQPTPRPDALAWLIQHREYWPQEVTLREATEFPAVSGGKEVGSVNVPAGSMLKVTDITANEIEADYMGGKRRVAVDATDLRPRAEAAFVKSEMESQSGKGTPAIAASASPKPSPEKIREATSEEIRNGLGAMYTSRETTFRIFAPNAKTVSLILYEQPTGDAGRSTQSLRKQSGGLWEATVRGNLWGKYYTFLLDQADSKRTRELLDPYATNSVANSTRGRITPLTTALGHGPNVGSPTDAIVYEMHVRDFTIATNSGVKDAGLYLGWTEPGTHVPGDEEIQTALDHLTQLGITHVELMPVQDFDNDEASRRFNWGYITSAFFSPEGMFATNPDDDSRVRELKALIRTLHSRGINVIMDVVYNHTSGNASLLSIAPDQYYRHQPNGSLANGSGCGNEVKSESPIARRLIIDSLKFWTKEYGVDGFRFDLMALIDQETMRQAERELRKINPSIILFGEPWTGGTTPLREKSDKTAIRNLPVGAFNDDFRNALKGSPDHDDPGWVQNGSKRDALKAAMLVSDWCTSPAQSINYMTCHDNLVLWDKLVHSMPGADDALRIETMKLGYLALLTSQGVPFMHGGEEFARTKGGNNNSFEAPDSVNEVDWALKRQHLDLFHYVRDLIGIRKAHPMFRLRTKSEVRSRVNFIEQSNHGTLMYTVSGEGVAGENWKRACVILNSADSADAELILPGGEWNVALDDHGALSEQRMVSGKINLRYKSGAILYHQ